MASKSKFVNLDAMIQRADFSLEDSSNSRQSYDKLPTIALRDLTDTGLIRPILRKPDFQRETNHWAPEQVASLIECFVNGDLIPSVIFWKSPSFLFVIDGGHRLSALRAWIEDDYGDGPVSLPFFGNVISREQKKAAEKTRSIIATTVGTWGHLQSKLGESQSLDSPERNRVHTAVSRGIHIQWVEGNPEKAEASFFKINTQGTPLDDVEELLLSNRKKPIAIAARAVIRAGMGHRYWSKFPPAIRDEITALAKKIHHRLFQPEFDTPIKTLELPIGGSTGVRAALQVLIEFALAANRDAAGSPKAIKDLPDDDDGALTRDALTKTFALAARLTGNDRGSLGLHPAIYFYGPSGRHQSPMFLGVALLVSQKLINNDNAFFIKFSKVRGKLEQILIEKKTLIAAILQQAISRFRIKTYASLLDTLISKLANGPSVPISDEDIVTYVGLTGKVITGNASHAGEKFSEDTKSSVFITNALKSGIKCPICDGYLDTAKSVSYDHIVERASGGSGSEDNCQLTHPYCNQSVKNGAFQRNTA